MSLIQRNYNLPDQTIVCPIYMYFCSQGHVWFKIDEIAIILGCLKTLKVVIPNIHNDDKRRWGQIVHGSCIYDDIQSCTCFVNESGLYQLIALCSPKKETMQFCRWITTDVLPSVREEHNKLRSGINSDPGGYVYVATNDIYQKDGAFTIGSTKDLACITTQLNKCRRVRDIMYFVYCKYFKDCQQAEREIQAALDVYREMPGHEIFVVPSLEQIIKEFLVRS